MTATDGTVSQLRRASVDLPLTPPDSDPSDNERSEKASPGPKLKSDLPRIPQSLPPTAVLDPDKKTPDSWLPRDERLIRLTGAHPFNVEAPLTDLFNEGFLTSPELFYVRNHGPVPQVRDADIPDWEFTVEGMVEKPFKMTLSDLLRQYEQRTYPITLVCAGNRRKEQNMVRKTKGFSWGAAGVSTALFTGVSMAELLAQAIPKRGARYLCMEGADALPNGNYGTSIKLNWALDPNRGVMLAHAMNGTPLTPDHGKPLRCVIPGQIGGRSVKWLKRLIVTPTPSDNWYHLYDNRVLPTMVSPDEAANDPAWWQDERYAIYDLNPNSALAYPAHNQTLALYNAPQTFPLKGYAYAGGGRRITRVEISLDRGRTWKLAKIDYAEDRYREALSQQLCGGTLDMADREASFCWCFWELAVAVEELARCDDVCVRAMDEGMAMQPREMYWSVLGMMNNPWFRVVVHKEAGGLRFEHPTLPALQQGGWMERVKKEGGDLSNGVWGERIAGNGGEEAEKAAAVHKVEEVKMTSDSVDGKIEGEELKEHEGEDSPWFVINGEVYDGTAFLKDHPGGASSITAAAGQDCTDEFMAIHSETAKALMPTYHIGTLITPLSAPTPDPTTPAPTFLKARLWQTATLTAKTPLTPDTRLFTLTLPSPAQSLGLPVGQHLLLRLTDPATRQNIIRAYTPISPPTQCGKVDILIKIYGPQSGGEGGGATFAGGAMTTALASLPVGHGVSVKGPVGKFVYEGAGACVLNGVPLPKRVKRFVLICAGSGVTPIFQVLAAVMAEAAAAENEGKGVGDVPECLVLSGNRARGDVLCKAELDGFAERFPRKCRVVYTLSALREEEEEGWEGERGRIDGAFLGRWTGREEFGVGEGVLALVCGPKGMERGVGEALGALGWGGDEVVFF